MIERGKVNLLGVGVNIIDYEAAVTRIIAAAVAKESLAVTALAVHGVMTGVLDEEQRYRLNRLDLVVADGQAVRWALNLLHRASLRERVYGPTLMLKVCAAAADTGLPVFLYGSTREVLDRLTANLSETFTRLEIAGSRPSAFRRLTVSERDMIADELRRSGAAIVFVGLGCPRQETWAYEYRASLRMPLLAVGAAFDFHAGCLPQAPKWLQEHGLEWAFRLWREPRRLWKRYLLLNPAYLALVALQLTRAKQFGASDSSVLPREMRFG